ncbi:MAG: protein translocase subunit SecD [Rhodospirillaceae bacterium]|nr:protein translocase subunit SecD [Rhodospirillaceae bacterium]
MYISATKLALVIAVTIMSIVLCAPNMLSRETMAALPDWVPKWVRPMELGLDLQGGSYLLLEVDLQAVNKEQVANLEESVRAALREPRIGFRNLRGDETGVFVTVNDAEQIKPAREAILKTTPDVSVSTQEENRLYISYPEKVRKDRENSALNQSIEIVRRRVDEFGTSEPNIQRQGADRIIVELPGVNDPERIKALLGQTAKLNFHLVEPSVNPNAPARDMPPGTLLLPGGKDDPQVYAVRRRVEVSGERLIDAQASFQEGRPIVNFRFDTAGARRFGAVTSANVNQRLAIVLDNKVISAPNIKSPITGGSGYIEGSFTVQQAQDLALLLRAGALPAPLIILEERSVGPSLGADSIRDGQIASIVGGLLVTAFMVMAYFSFGVLAVIAMAINVISLTAVMTALGATLTLPGIAGIVLTLGMSVDSNVLIYERMREEFAAGRTLLNSLNSGFNQAFAAILDSNITQLISGLLMFFLGSGPIRGFAVTLTIGIFTSLFATTLVTRTLLILWYRSGKRTALPI